MHELVSTLTGFIAIFIASRVATLSTLMLVQPFQLCSLREKVDSIVAGIGSIILIGAKLDWLTRGYWEVVGLHRDLLWTGFEITIVYSVLITLTRRYRFYLTLEGR